MKSLIWPQKILFKDVENIKLPPSFMFITQYEKDVLFAVGMASLQIGIEWDDLKKVNKEYGFKE